MGKEAFRVDERKFETVDELVLKLKKATGLVKDSLLADLGLASNQGNKKQNNNDPTAEEEEKLLKTMSQPGSTGSGRSRLQSW